MARIGVIRGDLSKALFFADLEPKSQAQATIESPKGQSRYVSRPDATNVGSSISVAPAAVQSTADVTLPMTIDNSNHTLRVRLSSTGSYVVVTVANATYSSMTTLLAAINAAIVTAGLAVTAEVGSGALRVRLKTTAKGPGTYIQVDTVGNGSTGNTPLQFGSGGLSFTVPTAAAVITALLPVGGPLDVSSATILSTVSSALSAAQVKAVADAIAPQFVETDAFKKSYLKGNIHGYLLSTFNPDPRRLPAFTPGAAITVVQDDGVTAFTFAGPNIVTAAKNVPSSGALRITGMNLAPYGAFSARIILLGSGAKKLRQADIEAGGGSVTATQIDIPAALVPGIAATSTSARVEVNDLLSSAVAVS